jgi:fructuronate reductase
MDPEERAMVLRDKELQNRGQWEKAGIELPAFDRNAMIKATRAAPEWVHFGSGNIFRAFPALCQQQLLERGIEKTGIIAAAGRSGEIIDKILAPCDNLTLAVTLGSDGTIRKKVVASIAASFSMEKAGFEELKKIFRSPSLKMASFTITEKGYRPQSEYMEKITALCYERFRAGAHPLAMVSMDNCSRNGERLFEAIRSFASAWPGQTAEKEFAAYIKNRISFPWTVIDKITPGPGEEIKAMLEKAGFEDTAILVTKNGSRAAPFVNAEESGYLVIEDNFPAGRPALEKAGVYFTDRDTVEKFEKMKVSTCLNPLHTALAIFGCLLEFTRISDEMKDPRLVRLIEGIGYDEGLPAAPDPGIVGSREFLDEVIRVRFPNPFIPDTPQRIASDTSQKIPVRFGETIKAYMKGRLDIKNLKLIPLVLAAWVRYLTGIDDEGKPFTVSPDPLYESLASALSGIASGGQGPFHDVLAPILSNSAIFAVNLYEAGLGEKVEAYFTELMAGKGAVAAALTRYTSQVPA